jgi:hypothetical protein
VCPKKHKLSVSIDEDYCLLGIVSDEPDYKLCWLVNQQTGTSFARADDLKVFSTKQNTEQLLSLFVHEDEQRFLTYRLIVNRTSAGYFLAELKNIDYFLHIQGEIVPDAISQVIRQLNGINAVRMCVPVDLGKVREREKLQLW